MPEVNWKDINVLLHKLKDSLQIAYQIEHTAKKLRKRVGEEIEKIEEIILSQE